MVVNINGHLILIDSEDYHFVQDARWSVDARGYVQGYFNGKYTRLHRLIARASADDIVDHINRDVSDNRKCNLRNTDRFGNARNSKTRSHNTSGYRGVHLCKSTGRWRAEIRVNGRGIKLGRFDSREDAARAYDMAARAHHRDFAVLNFTDACK